MRYFTLQTKCVKADEIGLRLFWPSVHTDEKASDISLKSSSDADAERMEGLMFATGKNARQILIQSGYCLVVVYAAVAGPSFNSSFLFSTTNR